MSYWIDLYSQIYWPRIFFHIDVSILEIIYGTGVFYKVFPSNIKLAWVTLCRLGDPIDFIYGGAMAALINNNRAALNCQKRGHCSPLCVIQM